MKIPSPPPRYAFDPCPAAQAFRFRDGASVRSLQELHERLRSSAVADLVAFHRGHFAPWLRDVVGDAPLARRVEDIAASGAVPDALQDALRGLCATRLQELGAAR